MKIENMGFIDFNQFQKKISEKEAFLISLMGKLRMSDFPINIFFRSDNEPELLVHLVCSEIEISLSLINYTNFFTTLIVEKDFNPFEIDSFESDFFKIIRFELFNAVVENAKKHLINWKLNNDTEFLYKKFIEYYYNYRLSGDIFDYMVEAWNFVVSCEPLKLIKDFDFENKKLNLNLKYYNVSIFSYEISAKHECLLATGIIDVYVFGILQEEINLKVIFENAAKNLAQEIYMQLDSRKEKWEKEKE